MLITNVSYLSSIFLEYIQSLRLEDVKFQWFSKHLYKQRIIPVVLLLPIDLDLIQFFTNGIKMTVEKKVQSFINIDE